MQESDFNMVCRLICRGSKYSLGKNAAGRLRIKVYTGPFGIFVKRYPILQEELDLLRRTVAAQRVITRGALRNTTQELAA